MANGFRIGVALSSGGAAGMAHVGVLEELIAAGIPIDCVAGTSAGAMVGAAWAAGRLDGFKAAMCSLTRRGVVALFDPTWPRTGLLEGQRPLDLIRPYIGETFEELPRPLAVVAADLMTGKEVVLRRGRIPEAVRASAAIPGLLTPVTIDGRMLVDGGIVNPIPVDVARELGADVVIAVTVLDVALEPEDEKPSGSMQEVAAQWLAKIFPRDEAASEPVTYVAAPTIDDLGIIEIMSRSSRIVQARLAEQRLRTDPPDAMVRIALPRISLFEFDRSSEAVLAGRQAAVAALPAIRAAIERAGSLSGRMARMLKPPVR